MFASYPSSQLKQKKVSGLALTDDWCSQQAWAPSQKSALYTDSSHVWGCRMGLITGPETHQRHPPPYLWASSKLPAKETLLQTSTLSDYFVIENSCSCWEPEVEEWKEWGGRTIHNFAACAELWAAITRQVRTGNSRDPVGMILSSPKGTDRKSKLLNLNHRWQLIFSNGLKIGSGRRLAAS